jgi:hypothetical protein
MSHPWYSRTAFALMLAATAFWLWFGIASAVAEQLGGSSDILHLLIPGGIYLLTTAFAWRWRAPGAVLLLAEGLLVTVGYPVLFARMSLIVKLLTMTTMGLPPMVAGVLLMADRPLRSHRPA